MKKIGIGLLAAIGLLVSLKSCRASRNAQERALSRPLALSLIIGTVRPTGTGEKIAQNIQAMLGKRTDVVVEIINLVEYQLPFYAETVSPASRTRAPEDPVLKRWSDTVQRADAFMIIAPEYNGGYSAPLKNALDSLYVEWNKKPVAFVGYSGGASGGAAMIAQLRHVAGYLQMVPVETDVRIAQSWKAVDAHGKLIEYEKIVKEVNQAVDQLIERRKNA